MFNIPNVRLAVGNHDEPGPKMCAMEMVAWLNGEEHSDSPQCSGQVLAGFVQWINDRDPYNNDGGDADRARLLTYLPRLIGTAGNERAHFDVLLKLYHPLRARSERADTAAQDAIWFMDGKICFMDGKLEGSHLSAGGMMYTVLVVHLHLDPFEILDRLIEAGPTGEFEPKRNPLTAAIELNMVPA